MKDGPFDRIRGRPRDLVTFKSFNMRNKEKVSLIGFSDVKNKIKFKATLIQHLWKLTEDDRSGRISLIMSLLCNDSIKYQDKSDKMFLYRAAAMAYLFKMYESKIMLKLFVSACEEKTIDLKKPVNAKNVASTRTESAESDLKKAAMCPPVLRKASKARRDQYGEVADWLVKHCNKMKKWPEGHPVLKCHFRLDRE